MMARTRNVAILAAAFFLADLAVIVTIGTRGPGPVLSDLLQLTLAAFLVFHCVEASRRSTGLARSFWTLAAASFSVVLVGLGLVAYRDAFPHSHAVAWFSNLLFCFWFFPMAMALFLDPEREGEGLDLLIALDFQIGRAHV